METPTFALSVNQFEHRVDNNLHTAIIKVKDWFPLNYIHSLYGDFYVLANWTESSDGKTVNYEARMTRAICANLQDACLLFFAK